MHPAERQLVEPAKQDDHRRTQSQRHGKQADQGHDDRIGKHSQPRHLVEIVRNQRNGPHGGGKGHQRILLSPMFQSDHERLGYVIFLVVAVTPSEYQGNGQDGHVRELKGKIEHRLGIRQGREQGGDTQRNDDLPLVTDPHREEIEQNHQQRSDGRHVGSRQQRIKHDHGDRDQYGKLLRRQDARKFLQPPGRHTAGYPSHTQKRDKGQQPQMRARYGNNMDRPRRHKIVTDARRDIILLSDDHAQEQTTSRLPECCEGRLAYLMPPAVDLPPYPCFDVEKVRMLNLNPIGPPDDCYRVNPMIPEVGAIIKPARVARAEGRANASTNGDPVSPKHVRLGLTLVTESAWTPRQAQISTNLTTRCVPLDGFHGHDHCHSTWSVLDRFRHNA